MTLFLVTNVSFNIISIASSSLRFIENLYFKRHLCSSAIKCKVLQAKLAVTVAVLDVA